MRITARDRDWLEHFAAGERRRPHGMGPGGVSNVVSRKWMVRIEREVDFGPELYRLTSEGIAALERMRREC